MVATEEVDVGFTETHRIYTSNNDAQADADLKADAKAAAANFFSQENRPPDLGIAKVTYATLTTSLDALLAAYSDFYGLVCQDRLKQTQNDLADWVAANERFGINQSSDAEILAGTAANLFETLNGDTNNRAAGIWHDDDTEWADVAWMARILAANPDQFSSVAYDKILTGISSPTVTAAQKATVQGYNGELYLPLKSQPVTGLGKLFGGKWIDDLILEDWFKSRLEEGIAALKIRLSNINKKIPYTNLGLRMIETEIRSVYKRGVGIGHFEPDTLEVATPDISAVSDADILARQCTIPVTCAKTGGIRKITLNVGVVNA
jgi:hypothetical protein